MRMVNMTTVKCVCGCGCLLAKFDSRGRPRRFIHGHQRKGWRGDSVKSAYRIAKETFDAPKGYVRHHIDGDPHNNEESNIAIITRGEHLVIHIPNRWTDEEEALVRSNYEATSKETILSLLPNRNWSAIKLKGRRLGVRRMVYPRSERKRDVNGRFN